ncbi:MAG: AtpZ/AtpI family protein [Planctomyces sp.]|nr:AtpZ/AtpI family protein [Planctomyces sp.]
MDRRQTRISQIAQAYRAAHEVVSAAIGLALLAGGGYWLDRKYGYLPILTIVGVCLGCITAVTSLRRLLARLDRESAKQRRERTENRGTSNRE